jgi:cytohesin
LVPKGNIHELLIEAAGIGSVKAIKACLDAKVDIDYQSRSRHQDRNGRAVIHLVAKRGQLAALEALIEGRVDVDLVEPIDGEIALHIAARNGHAEMVRYLVLQKVDLDVRNIHGLTPLMVASTEGIQKILLDAGASPNIKDRNGVPILYATIRRGLVGTVRKLVAKGAHINHLNGAGRHALGVAYDFSKVSEEVAAKMIEIPLISSASWNRILNVDKVELLLQTANNNKLQILRTLLNSDADILSRLSPQGSSPLHVVARTGSVNILQELLHYAREVNFRDPAISHPYTTPS